MIKLMLIFALKLFSHEQMSVLANSNSCLQYLFLPPACRGLLYRHIWFGTSCLLRSSETKVVTGVNVTGLRALAGNQMTESMSFAFSDSF